MASPQQAPPRGTLRIVAAGSIALGPLGAWLYQTGRMDLFGDAYLLNVALVVAMAVAGMGAGLLATVRGAPVPGIVSLLVNGGVAAFYGFLVMFFGLGGSR
jgi:hypothetical protein